MIIVQNRDARNTGDIAKYKENIFWILLFIGSKNYVNAMWISNHFTLTELE